ncbi:MAG: hypothetical protein ACYC0C_13430 [Devosia sp.]
MKASLSYLRLLLTAIVATAGILLAIAGSVSAEQLSGGEARLAAEVQYSLVANQSVHELAATIPCPKDARGTDCGPCCVNATGSGCGISSAICADGAMLLQLGVARHRPASAASDALGGTDPRANERPPQRLA